MRERTTELYRRKSHLDTPGISSCTRAMSIEQKGRRQTQFLRVVAIIFHSTNTPHCIRFFSRVFFASKWKRENVKELISHGLSKFKCKTKYSRLALPQSKSILSGQL